MTLWFSPTSGSVANGIYLVAYQNGKKIASVHGSDAKSPGVLQLWYGSSSNAPVPIQIGNYIGGSTISYSLSQ